MDMQKDTTTYRALQKKYDGFHAPTIKILAGKKELTDCKGLCVTELDIELTCGNEASGCTFVVEGEYDFEKTDFRTELTALQLGESVEVKIGYIVTETVFSGYINDLSFSFGEEEAVSVRVECMDLKGLLMKNRRIEIFSEKSVSDVLNVFLEESHVNHYLKGKEISRTAREPVSLRVQRQSDYEIICEAAQRLGFEFFILQGKVFFREKEKEKSVLMKLEPQLGILSAVFSVSGQNLVRNIEIRSIDENTGEMIKGVAKASGKYSEGGTAAKLMGKSSRVYYEPEVADVQEATRRAGERLAALEEQFGTIECTCIGIPELSPGRFVQIERLSKMADGKYYITTVRHHLDSDGFQTIIRARVKSL